MKFSELDRKMRGYERSMDRALPGNQFLAARLDGRGFTRLTKETCRDLERPFDIRFNEAMVATVSHLFRSGFDVVYGYTQSDEISLLFACGTTTFDLKERKFLSILAGEASAAFTQAFGHIGVFDCRMISLPDLDAVADYFRWRQEDSNRNSLNAYVYWTLRDEGMSAREADRQLLSISNKRKIEILAERGIDYGSVPGWQRWGVGLYNVKVERKGFNPMTGKEETGNGNALQVDRELPLRDEYVSLVKSTLQPSVVREEHRRRWTAASRKPKE